MDGHGSSEESHDSGGAIQPALSKENCLFCQIIIGKIPSKKVFEDEFLIAILDINPANAGHVLLMPKEHYLFMPQVPSEVLAKMAIFAKKVSNAALRAVKSEGSTIFVANGGVAGQRAPHFIIHIIPRITGDGLALSVVENSISKEVESQVLKQLMALLSAPQSSQVAKEHDSNDSDLDAITDMLTGDHDE